MAPIATSEIPSEGPLNASPRKPRAKRIKLDHEGSSAPSNTSDDSALVSTSVPDDTTEASDVESDASSELSESSEEPSDEDSDEDSEVSDLEDGAQQDEELVVNLRANRGEKPVMKLAADDLGEDIRPFLKDFLPKLRAANEELEAQRKAGTLETSELGEEEKAGHGQEQYIEMNLGLGVLKTKTADISDPSDSDSDDEEDSLPQEKDIMRKLMGRAKKTKAAAGVQEVDEAHPT